MALMGSTVAVTVLTSLAPAQQLQTLKLFLLCLPSRVWQPIEMIGALRTLKSLQITMKPQRRALKALSRALPDLHGVTSLMLATTEYLQADDDQLVDLPSTLSTLTNLRCVSC